MIKQAFDKMHPSFFVRIRKDKNFPISLYGTFVKICDAKDSVRKGKEWAVNV
jgi:hypothetical protein